MVVFTCSGIINLDGYTSVEKSHANDAGFVDIIANFATRDSDHHVLLGVMLPSEADWVLDELYYALVKGEESFNIEVYCETYRNEHPHLTLTPVSDIVG